MAHAWLCGVDKGLCTGTGIIAGAPYMHKPSDPLLRAHMGPEDAFKCKVRSLIIQGWERIEPRVFRKEGQPLLIIPKRSKFGQRVYYTKNKSRYELPNDEIIIVG